MSAIFHAAIAEIAARQADLLADYHLLELTPGINPDRRRAPFLEAYAELECCAATLRHLAGPVSTVAPVVTVGPAAISRGKQRRNGLYTPPPAPLPTTVVVTRSASWWTRPDVDFREEAERLRVAAVPKGTDAYLYGEEERRALMGRSA